MGALGSRGQRFVRIERDAIRNARDTRIAFRQYRAAGLERDLQKQAVDHGQFDVLNIKVRVDRRMLFAFESGERLLGAAGDDWVEADDRIFSGKLVVRHLDRSVAAQDRLESIDRGHPREVLDVACRLSYIPSDHHAVRQFLNVASSGHSRLEENTDRGDGVD